MLDHRLDARVIQIVGMVDNVDTGLDALEDLIGIVDVRANPGTAFIRSATVTV